VENFELETKRRGKEIYKEKYKSIKKEERSIKKREN